MRRFRLYLAGLVALLIGMPLCEKAFASALDIVDAGIALGLSIANASEGS